MKIKNRLNKKINKIYKKQQTNINQVWYYLSKIKKKNKGEIKNDGIKFGTIESQ